MMRRPGRWLGSLLRGERVARWLRRLVVATISVTVAAVFLSAVFLGWQLHGWFGGKPPVRTTVNRPIKVVREQQTSADRVPNLVGLAEPRAREVLADAGVDLNRLWTSKQPYAGEPGVVIAQTPVAGSSLKSGTITLTVSAPAKMPGIKGMSLQDARTMLEQIGATALVETRYQPGAAENTVLVTKPAAGRPLADRATVVVAEPPSAVFLTQLSAISSNCGTNTLNVDGVAQKDALVCQPGQDSPAVMEYLLNRRAAEFQALLGLGDRGATDTPVTFRVFVDGRRAIVLTLRFGQTHRIAVPVVGALRIRIEAAIDQPGPSGQQPQGVFANARFLGGQRGIDQLIVESKQ